MAITPVYGWEYQTLADAPNGALLGEDLALDIEATVAVLAASLVTAQANITTLQGQVTTLQGQALYRARQTLSGTSATITFDGIPSTLRSVEVRFTARATTAGAQSLQYRINNDSTANYLTSYFGTDNAAYTTPVSGGAATSGDIGIVSGNTTANEFSGGFVTWAGWDGPHASRLNCAYGSIGQVTGVARYTRFGGSVYQGAAPYTRIDFLMAAASFEAGTSFELIGIPA